MEISAGRHARSVLRAARSRTGKLVLGGASAILALGLVAFAALRFDSTPWSLSHANPALLAAAVVLFLLAYGLKAYGWKRLFLASERPQALALAAASGGASVMGVALPGRFDDAVRIAIVRRCPGCRVGVRALCLSLFMLGLIDAAALVPFASVAAAFSGQAIIVRIGLALVAGAGTLSALIIVILPRVSRSGRFLHFRLGRWLKPRTTSFRAAAEAWALVSACWIVRALALLLLLAGFGVGVSITLALLLLCAGAASAALPFGLAGAATQVGGGAAALIATGVRAPQALDVAFAAQTLGVLCGGAILFALVLWRIGLRVGSRRAPVAYP